MYMHVYACICKIRDGVNKTIVINIYKPYGNQAVKKKDEILITKQQTCNKKGTGQTVAV